MTIKNFEKKYVIGETKTHYIIYEDKTQSKICASFTVDYCDDNVVALMFNIENRKSIENAVVDNVGTFLGGLEIIAHLRG